MNPFTISPATMLTIAATMNDADIARATERRLAREVRDARRAESRRRARATTGGRATGRLRWVARRLGSAA